MKRTPWWFTLIAVVAALPAAATPVLLARCSAATTGAAVPAATLVWIYPFYMLLSAWLAWRAYPHRAYISWLLVAVMALTAVAISALVDNV